MKLSKTEESMRFHTQQACEDWLRARDRLKPDVLLGLYKERVRYPAEHYRTFFAAHWIATSLTYRRPTLLWITEWGIWPSSENHHLYYRLRQTYNDHRLLREAPGHLFLEHEAEDMASFLQLAMLNGWGGYVLTDAGYVNAFFSHDEFIDFFAEADDCLSDVRKVLAADLHAPE